MPAAAEETAYFLNSRIRAVALIAKDVRFPAGTWIRIADGTALAWHVEDLLRDMFPALRDAVFRFATLTSEFDVNEFEVSMAELR
jgi:hypothetical protein